MQQSIQLTQAVDAPPERAWHACSEPAGLAAWQADEVKGRVVPGGRLLLSWPALGASIELTVEELQAGRRLVLQGAVSRLALVVEPGRVILTQDGLSAGDEAEGTASSWRLSLAVLAHYLTHHDGATRQVSWFVRPVRTNTEAAHALFTREATLRTWLTRGGEIAEPGSRVRLRLAWGDSLTGTVLAHTPGRDVAVSWTEQAESVLALRTLPSPRTPGERLVAMVWSHWGDIPSLGHTEEQLARAVERLAGVLGGDTEPDGRA